MTEDESLQHLRARRDRLAHEIELMRGDIEHWNRTHPHEAPIRVDDHVAEPAALLAGLDKLLGLA